MRNAGADCLPVRWLLFLLFLGGVGSAQLLSVLSRAFLHGGDELLGAALARLNYVVNGELDLLRLQLHAKHLGKDTMQRYNDRVNQPPVKEVHPAGNPYVSDMMIRWKKTMVKVKSRHLIAFSTM